MDMQVDEDVLAMGAGGVVHKPFARAELTQAVDALLAGSGYAAEPW
jgi:DNA-binding response OmpR family regulator